MRPVRAQDTVGSVVTSFPPLSRVFEKERIDYCCGGKKTVEEACRERGVNTDQVLRELESARAEFAKEPVVDPASMSLRALADHIEQTHHAFLRVELPRLDWMTEKVAAVHGAKDPRLFDVRATFVEMADEMASHMAKEEQVLFPLVRQLEANPTSPAFPCGSITHPIEQMELEHEHAGSALERLRTLTNGYVPPEWACNTYRAMLDALAHLEADMHQHVHKENNVLFPRAIEMEQDRVL